MRKVARLFLVLMAIVTLTLAHRQARSPGGGGWQSGVVASDHCFHIYNIYPHVSSFYIDTTCFSYLQVLITYGLIT
ncbi:hypothetical protein evm_002784 [Chilo suppressalis]|nr:hypothetical protein evm_002784 [Chilo suppressalis]